MLSLDERMELGIGPNVLARVGLRREVIGGHVWFSVFESDDARRRAWVLHRDVLLAAAPSRDALPWAWHRYERGEPPKWLPEHEEVAPVVGEVDDDELLFASVLDDESPAGGNDEARRTPKS